VHPTDSGRFVTQLEVVPQRDGCNEVSPGHRSKAWVPFLQLVEDMVAVPLIAPNQTVHRVHPTDSGRFVTQLEAVPERDGCNEVSPGHRSKAWVPFLQLVEDMVAVPLITVAVPLITI